MTDRDPTSLENVVHAQKLRIAVLIDEVERLTDIVNVTTEALSKAYEFNRNSVELSERLANLLLGSMEQQQPEIVEDESDDQPSPFLGGQ